MWLMSMAVLFYCFVYNVTVKFKICYYCFTFALIKSTIFLYSHVHPVMYQQCCLSNNLEVVYTAGNVLCAKDIILDHQFKICRCS